MRCDKCGAEGIPGKKFCAECGAPLSNHCPKCGSDCAPTAKFCADCGTVLAPPAAAAANTSDDPQIRATERLSAETQEGERKTVTALFADIKGSMELIEDLDPEEARAIVDPALKLMMEAVHHYGGYVAQSTGDGIFALFGAPVGHEDHPQRALFAALRMQEELKRYSDGIRSEGRLPVQVRVGVNTGEVVVRSIETGEAYSEYTPIGHSISMASRMQALAPIGSIAATEPVRKLCEGYFVFKSLGPTKVKGVSEPVNVYEVTGLGPIRTRLQRAAARGYTRFVGRQREMDAMKHAAEQAKAGHGQIVAAMADAGVGKSRLFFEFKATSQSGWLVLDALSLSHDKATAYVPLSDLLHVYFRITPDDDARTRREKVAGKIAMLDRSLEETLPHLFALLGIVEGDDALEQMDGQVRRRRTQDAVKRILLRESLGQPLMLIFEDLHWIDEETQAFLNLLADGIATSPVLMLLNYRPEYSHQWGEKSYYTQLRLDPLGKESADEMLSALVGDAPELAPLKRLVLQRTEGNPLFMEEVVQALFDEGALVRNGAVKVTRSLGQLKIPPTVQGILAARIDRLPPEAKELLQTLAVIGTEFPLGLVRQVVPLPPERLDGMLSDLQTVEFIFEQPAAGDIEYIFKHALTHDVAYNSLLTERRRLLHERIGHAIEALYHEQLENHLSELAHHFDQSRNVLKAVQYLSRIGYRAAQQVAHSEAVGCFTRALQLLPRLPAGTARDRQELDLQMAVNSSLVMARGYRASPERERALVRARELCEHLEDSAKLMETLLALAHFRFNQGEFGQARELAERVLAMPQLAKVPAMLGGVHFVLGLVRYATGQFPSAREHFEFSAELLFADPSGAQSTRFFRVAPTVLGGVLIILGYPVTANRRDQEWLAAARRSSNPFFISSALLSDGLHHLLLHESGPLAERADEILSIATQHEMPFQSAVATFFRGWAMADAGRGVEGIAEMRRSISDAELTAATTTVLLLVALAETCGKHGHSEEGLDLVTKGLATAEQIGMRLAEAELHRLKGELLLIKDPGKATEAECSLRTAIDVARQQGARLFELRATASLARLLKQRGETAEARQMVAEIYNWFTEGFATADLKDAKALLEELSA